MKRIAITGPESTGKTTLSIALQKHFKGDLITEYAREYLEMNGGEYEFEDLINITNKHLNNIVNSQNSTQIIDTDFILMKIWYDDKFGKTPADVIELINDDIFDLHILCAPDIPWEEDELREDPHNREALFEKYIEELDRFKKNYIIVQGSKENRLNKSIEVISRI